MFNNIKIDPSDNQKFNIERSGQFLQGDDIQEKNSKYFTIFMIYFYSITGHLKNFSLLIFLLMTT